MGHGRADEDAGRGWGGQGGGAARPDGWSSLTSQLRNPRPHPPNDSFPLNDSFPPLAAPAETPSPGQKAPRGRDGLPLAWQAKFSSDRGRGSVRGADYEPEGFSSNTIASNGSAWGAADASFPAEESSRAAHGKAVGKVGGVSGTRIPGGNVGPASRNPYRVQSRAYEARLRSVLSDGASDEASRSSADVKVHVRGAQVGEPPNGPKFAPDGRPSDDDGAEPSVSDGRSAMRDAEREVGSGAYEQQRQQSDDDHDDHDAGGDSTAANSSNFRPPSEPEWEERDEYHTFRADALKVSRARDKLARGASQAFMRGDHKKAKALSRQAKEKQVLAEKLHTDAASEILSRRNYGGSVDVWHLDLHGLHAAEAIAAVRARLAILEGAPAKERAPGPISQSSNQALRQQEASVTSDTSCADRDCIMHDSFQSLILGSKLLSIVTGVGAHSQQGASLPAAVNNFLITNGYYLEEPRPGVVCVRPKLRFPVQ